MACRQECRLVLGVMSTTGMGVWSGFLGRFEVGWLYWDDDIWFSIFFLLIFLGMEGFFIGLLLYEDGY